MELGVELWAGFVSGGSLVPKMLSEEGYEEEEEDDDDDDDDEGGREKE